MSSFFPLLSVGFLVTAPNVKESLAVIIFLAENEQQFVAFLLTGSNAKAASEFDIIQAGLNFPNMHAYNRHVDHAYNRYIPKG